MNCVTISIATACSLMLTSAAYAQTTARFVLPSGVTVRIVEAPFDSTKFKVQGCVEEAPGCRINGRIPFGSAFGLPTSYVRRISVSFKGHAHVLDSSQMYNAWGDRPLEVKGAIRYFGGKCDDARNCRFRGVFSDAAGSFVAEWLVVDGVPTRTVLTDSNDVVHFFMQNIDPPEFE